MMLPRRDGFRDLEPPQGIVFSDSESPQRMGMHIMPLAAITITMFVLALVYGVHYQNDPCMNPTVVSNFFSGLNLSNIVITCTSAQLVIVMLIACRSYTGSSSSLSLAVIITVSLFALAWNVCLIVTLFIDATQCRANGLWVVAVIQFALFIATTLVFWCMGVYVLLQDRPVVSGYTSYGRR